MYHDGPLHIMHYVSFLAGEKARDDQIHSHQLVQRYHSALNRLKHAGFSGSRRRTLQLLHHLCQFSVFTFRNLLKNVIYTHTPYLPINTNMYKHFSRAFRDKIPATSEHWYAKPYTICSGEQLFCRVFFMFVFCLLW